MASIRSPQRASEGRPLKKKNPFPESLVLIFAMIVIAQLLSYVLPAGEFDREDRRVVPNTYHRVDAESLDWHAFVTKIPKGMEAGAEIIFFVFIVVDLFLKTNRKTKRLHLLFNFL